MTAIQKAREAKAWNCAEWPEWLHKIVDKTNEVADRLDMSSEQAMAYAALAALDAETEGWRTMDSAPKDGTRVDIWLEPHDAEESGNAHRRTDAYFQSGDWMFRSNSGGGPDVPARYHWRVVAWRHLPVPPVSRS